MHFQDFVAFLSFFLLVIHFSSVADKRRQTDGSTWVSIVDETNNRNCGDYVMKHNCGCSIGWKEGGNWMGHELIWSE